MPNFISSADVAFSSLPTSRGREVIRCLHCKLVQFKDERKFCRRCNTPFLDIATEDVQTETYRHRFAETVHYFRKEQNLSRADLAARVKTSLQAIVKIENGEHEPSLDDLFSFSVALGCTPYWFVTVLETGTFLYEISRLLLFVSSRDRHHILALAQNLISD